MPTINLSTIGQLEIGGESEFGDETSNYEFVQCLTADLGGLTAASLRNDALRQADTEAARIVGVKTGAITTTHYLHGFSGSVPTGAPGFTQPTSNAEGWDVLMSIMARGLGGLVAGSYNGTDTVGASGTPSTDTITVADAGDGLSNWNVGEAIAWATGDTLTPYEIGYVTALDLSTSPDEGTLLQTPAYDPQGTKVWGGYNIFKTTGDPYKDVASAPQSYSVKFTRDDGTVCTMVGCCPTQVTFSIAAGELPTMTIEWGVGSWTEATGGTLTQQDMNNNAGTSVPGPEAVTQWLVRWGSGSSVKDLTTASVEVTLGLTVNPIAGGYSSGGIEDYFTAKRDPMVTVKVPRVFADEPTDWESQNGEPLQIQIGTQPGRMWGLAIPVARVMNRPNAEDENSAIYNTVEFYPCVYTGDVVAGTPDPDTEPVDSDMRICWV
jgi:hypothetical protein